MTVYCILCRNPIPEKRARRNAATCSLECQRELKRAKSAAERESLAGNTCPRCLRYVPTDCMETALKEGMRLISGLGHGNSARFA
jgi:hypothetical protein